MQPAGSSAAARHGAGGTGTEAAHSGRQEGVGQRHVSTEAPAVGEESGKGWWGIPIRPGGRDVGGGGPGGTERNIGTEKALMGRAGSSGGLGSAQRVAGGWRNDGRGKISEKGIVEAQLISGSILGAVGGRNLRFRTVLALTSQFRWANDTEPRQPSPCPASPVRF